MPAVLIEKMHTASPRNPLGAKGLGEAGCIAMPPAVVNAAVDALAPLGVTHLDMPLTPERLRAALRRAAREPPHHARPAFAFPGKTRPTKVSWRRARGGLLTSDEVPT